MVSTWRGNNTFGFVWTFEPKLQGEFAPNLCGANLKQTDRGALVNDFVKAEAPTRPSWLFAILRSGGLGESFWGGGGNGC